MKEKQNKQKSSRPNEKDEVGYLPRVVVKFHFYS